MPYQPPKLSLSNEQSALAEQSQKLRARGDILGRIVDGESILTVAQDLTLSESAVNEVLKESLAVSTEFMREQAALYQQILVQRYETLYAFAISRAFANTPVYDKEGNYTGSIEGSISWFEQAKKIVDSTQALLKPYLGQEKKSGDTINITFVTGSPMHEKAANLLNMADMDPFGDD